VLPHKWDIHDLSVGYADRIHRVQLNHVLKPAVLGQQSQRYIAIKEAEGPEHDERLNLMRDAQQRFKAEMVVMVVGHQDKVNFLGEVSVGEALNATAARPPLYRGRSRGQSQPTRPTHKHGQNNERVHHWHPAFLIEGPALVIIAMIAFCPRRGTGPAFRGYSQLV
jgi:hypothetical protein